MRIKSSQLVYSFVKIETTITDLKSRRTKLALDEDRFNEQTKLLNIDKENLRREQTEFTSEKQQLNILKDSIEAQRRQLKQQKAKLKESKRQPEVNVSHSKYGCGWLKI